MRLRIATPVAIVADEERVAAVRAEDSSGCFGILPGHAAFVTVLAVSVLSWRCADGGTHHAAVRGGVLTVSDGERVEVATREAVTGDDLLALERDVLSEMRRARELRADERARATRLHVAAIRRICRYLQAGSERAGTLARRSAEEAGA